MSDILVVGSLAYDSITTPSGSAPRTLGGSANYFSVAASLMASVRVVGVVGQDYEAKDLQVLHSRSVDVSGLQVKLGKTFHWEGSYEGDLNEAKTHKTELNVFADFQPQIPSKYENSRFVFLANISPDLQGAVLDQVREPFFVGMDTMNFWISSKLPDLKKTISRVDALLVNETEAITLTGAANAIDAAPKLCKMGPKAVVIKRGEYGFVLYQKNAGFFILPAFPVEKVVDPTGAGDSFAGGFFGYLARLNRRPEPVDLKRACVHGTVMASFTIQDFGLGALTQVTLSDLEERMKLYHQVFSL